MLCVRHRRANGNIFMNCKLRRSTVKLWLSLLSQYLFHDSFKMRYVKIYFATAI